MVPIEVEVDNRQPNGPVCITLMVIRNPTVHYPSFRLDVDVVESRDHGSNSEKHGTVGVRICTYVHIHTLRTYLCGINELQQQSMWLTGTFTKG
jgi:hypothetical protein